MRFNELRRFVQLDDVAIIQTFIVFKQLKIKQLIKNRYFINSEHHLDSRINNISHHPYRYHSARLISQLGVVWRINKTLSPFLNVHRSHTELQVVSIIHEFIIATGQLYITLLLYLNVSF